MNEKLKNLIIRALTAAVLVVPAWYIFVYLPPIATTIGLIIVACWILFVELPQLVSPKTWQFYPLALAYICLPIWLMIAMNQNQLLRLYLIGAVMWIIMHDTGAYLVGTFLGRNKMAPTISPNKTWEGFLGGFLALMAWNVYSVITMYKQPVLSVQTLFFVGFSLVVTALATLGDLFESWLKRRAGVKDSGWILPGHGGLLDRLDSLLFITPAMVIYIAYMMHKAFPALKLVDVLKQFIFVKF